MNREKKEVFEPKPDIEHYSEEEIQESVEKVQKTTDFDSLGNWANS